MFLLQEQFFPSRVRESQQWSQYKGARSGLRHLMKRKQVGVGASNQDSCEHPLAALSCYRPACGHRRHSANRKECFCTFPPVKASLLELPCLQWKIRRTNHKLSMKCVLQNVFGKFTPRGVDGIWERGPWGDDWWWLIHLCIDGFHGGALVLFLLVHVCSTWLHSLWGIGTCT